MKAILTGALAYQIKKLVDLGFVDFSSLAVLEHQLSHHDPLTDQEKQCAIQVAMGEACDFAGLLRQLEIT